MENSPEIKAFIKENSSLFWYTPEAEKENIDHEFLVEHILNYGDLDAVVKLIKILGLETVGKIFRYTTSLSERRKNNYFELTYNYFDLIFKKHAF